ncbi:MAG TPA: conjugal transfer protein TraT [Thiomicrorhabdus sp.]|nr:conjugal transfer protein TraT [Thiomicrorhabdus sp.]
MNLKPILIATTLTVGVTTLTGCSTLSTAIEKRNLSVQSKMTNSIFLEAVSNDKKTIFIQIKNSSDKDIDTRTMTQSIEKALRGKSYQIVNSPEQANYILQQNILSVAKTNKKNAYNAMDAGFGGATAGALIVGASGGGNYGMGALVGSIAGVAANALVKDVYYNLVSDIQIKEKTTGTVNYTTNANATSGSSMNTTQTVSGQSNYLTHSTRMVLVANQVNLDFIEAKAILEDKLSKSVAGIF